MTLREIDLAVLTLISRGYATEEIAAKLRMNKRTIDGIRLRLLKRAEARNTAQLVYYAMKHKILK